ncbi:hypothetical protein RW1_055_00350 [Rhodococcus wratislaviensis NBRC 100605]|uniref:Uncharacterized protein n=2 Tax=Rhodococcus wratislaviensis TaxID=44752 RepID=X0PYB7_RHOWR|nr:hypothetical protein RW1_055_00350 [Rhodococcus wratislaviensis NBRC 100605]
MGRSKKATQSTRAAKKQRSRLKRRARTFAPTNERSTDPIESLDPGFGLIHMVPEFTVEDYYTLRAADDLPADGLFDLIDPTLTRILTARREWDNFEDSSWDHVPHREYAFQAWGNSAEPLSITVSENANGPIWEVYYPNSGDGRSSPPSETYTNRDALVTELDRLEQLGHQRMEV